MQLACFQPHFTRWFTCVVSISTPGDLVRSEILFPFPSVSEFLRLGAAHPGDGGARFLNPGGFAESHLPTIPPAGQGWRTRIRSPPLQRTGMTKALPVLKGACGGASIKVR